MEKKEYRMESGFLAKKNHAGGVTLLRVYGTSPELKVPETIAGVPVTEIGAYCFARTDRLSGETREWLAAHKTQETAAQQEVCGEWLETLELPDSIKAIGNCAFYNCKSLRQLTTGRRVEELGSDVFMNCIGLKRLVIRGSIREKSGLQLILSRISTTVEVQFQREGKTEAALVYPEYFETYDEIAPAHLFGRNITGEGFRARQCFREGIVETASYDAIFPKACVEENGKVLSRMAVNRLRYPVGLEMESRKLYEAYVRAHETEIGRQLVKKRRLSELHFLCREKLFSAEGMADTIAEAAGTDWAEGTASLMTWKQEYYGVKKEDRYAFD